MFAGRDTYANRQYYCELIKSTDLRRCINTILLPLGDIKHTRLIK